MFELPVPIGTNEACGLSLAARAAQFALLMAALPAAAAAAGD
jgi:hypothetical protein